MGKKISKSRKKQKLVALCIFMAIGALTTGAVSTNETKTQGKVVYDGYI